MRILVIEDEQKVAGALREGLEAEGYEVATAYSGEEGFFLIHSETFDLVILDLMLPARDGLEVLSTLRRRGLQTPVLILTARDAVEDRVLGLDSGADDYLIKPFAFSELLARVRALLRRGRPDQVLRLKLADLEMDLVTRHVRRGSQVLELTPKEFDLIESVLPDEPDELSEVKEHGSVHLFQVRRDGRVILSVESEENGITANVDRSILRQASMNLLDNAIKYIRPGGTIRLCVKRLQNGRAAIEFIDEGPGIPPEHHEKIFERFYRIEKGRSRETGGTGLGLAIARWAVEVNGGRIELESKEGHGSIFRVLLPAPEATRLSPTDFNPIRKGGYK